MSKNIPIYPISGQYKEDETFDVSIVIPLYNSYRVIQDQIIRWPYDPDVKTEIIYVDDKCPKKSKLAVYQTWNKRKDRHNFNVRLIASRTNRGFGGACNFGAHFARGKYLVFLNADTIPAPNWLHPLLEPFEDKSVGIVGNMQLKDGGPLHGSIDGAGSEWIWEHNNFMHIGRHIYDGSILEKPYYLEETPSPLLKQRQVEMVTGCCFAIPKVLFDEVGGFDFHYRIGYWEDSELCMMVQHLGYKIVFQPESIIFHKLGHSEIATHAFAEYNKNYFINKWVNTSRIDKFVKQPRNIKPTKITNILVKRLEANGDVLVATGILPAIKRLYPKSVISFATKCPEVLAGNPHLQRVLKERQTAKYGFQWVIDLDLAYERRPHSNILKAYADMAGVPLEHCEPFLLQKSGVKIPEKKYAVIHAGNTAWVGRNWLPDRFNEIAKRLSPELDVVCVGGRGDNAVMCNFDYRGQLDIAQLAYVIGSASLFVGIDSFPMHVAQTFKIPGVCFFGSILPHTRIYRSNMLSIQATQLSCLGCHHRKLAPSTVTDVCETKNLECEKLVTIDQMWEKVKLCYQKS